MQKVFLFGLVLFFLLLFKNPLSPNNLISNLEPSPDAIHYLGPVKSLSEGNGFVISYQDRAVPPRVPPLYSLFLTPFYLLSGDIRSFYFANFLLALLSVICFYKILNKVIENRAIITILYLSFISNFVIFFYSSFAMAENLLLPLYLLSILLILKPITTKSMIALAFLAVAFFATKYVAWVLGLSLILIIILKKTHLRSFFLSLIGFGLVYLYIEFLTKGVNIINLSVQALPGTFKPEISKADFSGNLIRFLGGIIGGPAKVAGLHFTVIPISIGMTSLIAIFLNLKISSFKFLNLYFLISILGTIYYISTLAIVDFRYLLVFIPAFFIISGLFLDRLYKLFLKLNRKIYGFILILFVYISLILSIAPSAASEIRSNFLGRAVASNYAAIEVINEFTNSLNPSSKPIIISVLSPYQIDFFSNKKYDLLPISKHQYFNEHADKAWGINMQNDLMESYKNSLREGRHLYVSTYFTGKDSIYQFDLQKIKDNFNLTLVYEACNNTCSLYELKIPP